jgi:hypothetical protein
MERKARKKRRGVRTRHTGRPRSVFIGSLGAELTRALDLSVFPCARCGAASVAEHYDFATDRLLKLCKVHKNEALEAQRRDA